MNVEQVIWKTVTSKDGLVHWMWTGYYPREARQVRADGTFCSLTIKDTYPQGGVVTCLICVQR